MKMDDLTNWATAPLIRLDETPICITKAMHLIWATRPDLQAKWDINTFDGALSYFKWWLTHGKNEYPAVPYRLTEEQLRYLREPADSVIRDSSEPLPWIILMILKSREDLRSAFDVSTPEGRHGLAHWWSEHGRKEYADYLTMLEAELADMNEGAPESSSFGSLAAGGVNIVGFAYGELGIGEDVRMAAASFRSVGVPITIYNAPIHLCSRNEDRRLEEYASAEPLYKTNLITLPGMETARIFLARGPGLFKDRFTIGAWQWELTHWPAILRDTYRFVQEIWAPSRFIADAFRESAPVEVFHMPMAVEIDRVPDMDRANFGLPDDVFLFLFVFDSLSSVHRKNPMATVRAFQKAFPAQNDGVGLVIKCMNASPEAPWLRRLYQVRESDPRIFIIGETFQRERVLGLFNCCDALVSLHRAEGFGRTIAEAMLLGKPVVVSNYSGNTDFSNSETSFLVDGNLREVKEGEYPYGKGQYWFEPDLAHASELMAACVENHDLAQQKALAGRNLIRKEYCSSAVGKLWKARLRELGIIEGS